MATVFIQKRKRSYGTGYEVSYYNPFTGEKRYYKTYRKMRDAQQKANDLRAMIDGGKINDMRKQKSRSTLLTFSQAAKLLKEEWQHKLEIKDLREKTVVEYRNFLSVISKSFDKTLLCEIGEADIVAYQKKVAVESSNVTSNRHLFVIKQLFKLGVAHGAISDDPAAKIRYLSEKAHERNIYLLPAQLHKLIEASQKTRAKFYMPALIYLGAEHGASKQEALSLEWKDIDFDFADRGKIRFFRTKNGRERTEFIMPRTKEWLLRWREHLKEARERRGITEVKSDRVFCRLNGSPVEGFNKAWRRIREMAGFPGLHFHDLRHTFCSSVIFSGGDLKDAKEMIGHSDLSMTDRYSHLNPNYKLKLQEKLAAYYAETELW